METKLLFDYPEIKAGQTWNRKMRTLFRRLDSNGNGYLMIDDLLEVVSELLNNFPKIITSVSDDLVRGMVYLWYSVFAMHDGADEAAKTTAVINQDLFQANVLKAINGDFKKEFVNLFTEPLFRAADGDQDGLITGPEFSSIFLAFKAPKPQADAIFKALNKGGKMSLEIFNQMFSDFFGTDNPKSPCNKLWGELVTYKSAADYPEVECSPTWEGKMRAMFRRMDTESSGYLRCHNLITIGRSLAQRNHLDKKKSAHVLKSMLNIWVKFLAKDKSGKHFAEISEKEFVHNLRSMINGEFRHEIDQFGWTFFKAVEVDGNGTISMNEYRSLQESWNVGRDEAEGMFKVIDRDKDNLINADEYLNAWVEYFLSEDPNSPYKAFFGPVIIKHQDNR
ncbi:hypothetical protein Ciccas_002722 [Cichlidogyrus casuarinus]|uniref:EF-hand domain-containing protein n=1 Tax=Cichlidogyrus casuarinus TaxID=1844966 RepID=A0ABD2QGF1_9PLAT